MSDFTLRKALRLALTIEEQSIKLYTSAQDKVLHPSSKMFLKELVEEERSIRTKY